MKTGFLLLATIFGLLGASLGQSSVHIGAIPFVAQIRGGTAFTLTGGGPGTSPCYLGNGFCWSTAGQFQLHKVGTNGLCYSTCDVQGIVGHISTVLTMPDCSQISFPVSNVTLKIGTSVAYNRNAWYSQTSCNSPSGFMGGGTLFVYQ